jgi:glycosyltransferase involved in cell wall biosynthesis
MRYLIIHRPGEMPGGDVIAARGYAEALRANGVEVGVRPADDLAGLAHYDWIHIWSANAPQWAYPVASRAKQQGARVIMTPNWWSRKARLDFYGYHEQDVARGYTGQVAQTLALADHLFVCTMSEAVECWKLVPHKAAFLFRHGCDVGDVEPQEAEDYVLCLARVEQHKNQVNLAMACKALGVELLLVGAAADPAMTAQATALGAEHLPTLPHDEALKLLAKARVHALPSFSETPGMSNMEAALLQVPAVMGRTGAEPEFFGYGGIYVDPTEWRDIARGITLAWERGRYVWAFIPTWDEIAARAVEYLEGVVV